MGAHGLLEPDRVHSHRIGDGFGTSGVESSLGPSISWSSYLRGALAHSLVWGSLQVGALSPFITLALYHLQGPGTAVFFLSMAVLSVLVPFSHSPSFCRFYLGSAACVGGSTVWVPEKILQRLQAGGYLCLKPATVHVRRKQASLCVLCEAYGLHPIASLCHFLSYQ